MTLPDFLIQGAGGDIRLSGHRIGLYTVIRLSREGRTAEQIAQELPSLPLILVHQVLTFYRENKAEVDAYVDAYRAELDRLQAAYVPGPGILRLRHLKTLVRQADERYVSDPTWSSLTIIEKLQRLGVLPPTNPV